MRVPDRGHDDHLTRDEEEFIKRYLSRPESFPPEFWSAVMQKVVLDIDKIPGSQIVGGRTTPTFVATPITATNESTTSTTYTDLSTVGPRVDELSNGLYLVTISCYAFNNTGGVGTAAVSMMSVEANGDSGTLDDTNSVFTGTTTAVTLSSTFTIDLRQNNNNTLLAKYRVNAASTGTFNYRRMTALKIGS